MIKYLKDEKFEDEIQKEKVLVDFYADWCGPCKMMGQVLEEIEDTLDILKVNTDEHQEIAYQFKVMSIPTLILFKNGQEVKKNIGFLSKDELLTWLKDEENLE